LFAASFVLTNECVSFRLLRNFYNYPLVLFLNVPPKHVKNSKTSPVCSPMADSVQ